MSQESEAVTDWLLSVGPNTRRGYMYYLRRFCEFTGLTPDQLIREGVKDRRAVHRKLKEWHAKHKSMGMASTKKPKPSHTTIAWSIFVFLLWAGVCYRHNVFLRALP